MEDFLRFAGLAAFIGALIYYQARKERDAHWEEVEERVDNAPEISTEHNFEVRDETEQDKNIPDIDVIIQQAPQIVRDKIKTVVLERLYDTLRKLGGMPSEVRKNQLVFSYRGETFMVDVDRNFVRLIDPWWVILDIDDSRIGDICKIVNVVNILYRGPDIICTTDAKNRTFSLHTKADLNIDDPVLNLSIERCLGLFFDKKRNFFNELDRAKVPTDDSPQSDSSNKGTPPVDFNDLCMN